jgi:peroxiredoxin
VSPVEVGNTAPALDLTLEDANGESRRIGRGLTEGPVLVGIYKSSCQASKTMFPMLERLHEKYADKGLTVLGVAQDSANVTRSFARRGGITFPMLIEPEGYPISIAFDIFATPTVFLIRPDHTIAFTAMGFLRDQVNDLAKAVASELGQPPEPIIAEDEAGVPMFVPG